MSWHDKNFSDRTRSILHSLGFFLIVHSHLSCSQWSAELWLRTCQYGDSRVSQVEFNLLWVTRVGNLKHLHYVVTHKSLLGIGDGISRVLLREWETHKTQMYMPSCKKKRFFEGLSWCLLFLLTILRCSSGMVRWKTL